MDSKFSIQSLGGPRSSMPQPTMNVGTQCAVTTVDDAPHGVQLRRTAGWRKPANTVVVTRASKYWGNPFVIGKQSMYGLVADASTAVIFYERWLNTTDEGRQVLAMARRELHGRNLACFCGIGSPCHRTVLLALVNSAGGHE